MKKLRNLLTIINVLFMMIFTVTILYLLIDVKALSNITSEITEAGIFSLIRLLPVIICGIIIFINVLLITTFTRRDKTKEAIQFNNETGVVRISAHSIESLAKLEAQAMDAVSDIRTQIYSSDNVASLEVYAKVPPTVSIPEVSLALQNNIKRKILDTTGIELKTIKIIIDGILGPV